MERPGLRDLAPHGHYYGVEIRPSSTEDLPHLKQAFGAARAAPYSDLLKRAGVLLVSWERGSPTGAVFVRLDEADEEVVQKNLSGVPFVHRLFVPRHLRNQGRGRALVRAAEGLDEVRKECRLGAGIDLDSDALARWWSRLGYREWDHGLVHTQQENYEDDGTNSGSTPDCCRIFVRDLSSF